MEIREGNVGKKSFSHKDVAADILYLEHELCCLPKVNKKEEGDWCIDEE
jgi:hypothetical protein